MVQRAAGFEEMMKSYNPFSHSGYKRYCRSCMLVGNSVVRQVVLPLQLISTFSTYADKPGKPLNPSVNKETKASLEQFPRFPEAVSTFKESRVMLPV